jgi:hypothetical protein
MPMVVLVGDLYNDENQWVYWCERTDDILVYLFKII